MKRRPPSGKVPSAPVGTESVDEFLREWDHPLKPEVEAVRKIVEVTESDILGAGKSDDASVKLALKGLALNMAAELKPHGVAAVAITPGFLPSEAMMERFGVTEANWRDAGKKDKNQDAQDFFDDHRLSHIYAGVTRVGNASQIGFAER